MRKTKLALITATMLSSIAAFAYGGFSPSQLCKSNGDFGVPHDTCVNCVNNGADDFATCQCKLLEDGYFPGDSLQNEGFSNYGQCVSTLEQYK